MRISFVILCIFMLIIEDADSFFWRRRHCHKKKKPVLILKEKKVCDKCHKCKTFHKVEHGFIDHHHEEYGGWLGGDGGADGTDGLGFGIGGLLTGLGLGGGGGDGDDDGDGFRRRRSTRSVTSLPLSFIQKSSMPAIMQRNDPQIRYQKYQLIHDFLQKFSSHQNRW
jgi:hypothetical protein